MNIYALMNDMISYIEDNILEDITIKDLSKLTGLNQTLVKSIFPCLVGCGISEYIRNRRLSICVEDLIKGSKIIDVSIKYGYTSPNSFTRAFRNFHGVSPSKIKKSNISLKLFNRIKFSNNLIHNNSLIYNIYYKKKFILYGISKIFDYSKLTDNTPIFWNEAKEKYEVFSSTKKRYGFVEHIDKEKCKYYCLVDKEVKDFEKVELGESDYIGFKISSFYSKDISNNIEKCINNYLKSLNLSLKNLPVIEVYYNNYVELLVPTN